MGEFHTRKNLSRRLIITNSPKKRINLRKKTCKYLDNFVFKDEQTEMDFIISGEDQTKLKHSEKGTTCKGIQQKIDMNQKN